MILKKEKVMQEKQTQQELILNFCKRNSYITSLDAIKMYITDLQGQIKALERKGYKFDHVWAEGAHYKKYYLLEA